MSMGDQDFIANYLEPKTHQINPKYMLSPPPIAGLRPGGRLLIQSQQDDTISSNLLLKYTSDELGLRLMDVYKSTQHTQTGRFIRLWGTMSLVTWGHPYLFIDVAVSNVNPLTTQDEQLTTRVALHAPDATGEQRKAVFTKLETVAQKYKVETQEIAIPSMPAFWGHVWLAKVRGLSSALVAEFREQAFMAYCDLVESRGGQPRPDYARVAQHMAFEQAKKEHHLFAKMELSVPLEAQSAFFSALVSTAP